MKSQLQNLADTEVGPPCAKKVQDSHFGRDGLVSSAIAKVLHLPLKFANWIVSGIAMVILVGLSIWWCKTRVSSLFCSKSVTTTKTAIMFDRTKIKEIKELELLVLPYGDIKHNVWTNKSGRTVAEIHYMYNGVGQLSLDLEKVKIEEQYDLLSNITNLIVRLPNVKVSGARVFHNSPDATNEYLWVSGIIGDYKIAKNKGLADIEAEVRADAQQDIIKYMKRPENIELAKKSAELILQTLLVNTSSCTVKFTWPK